MSGKHTLRLNYFPISGRATCLRAAAELADEEHKKTFDFQVAPVSFEDWFNPESAARKDKVRFPTGDLPTLSITTASGESVVMSESIAIMTYIGQVTGFWPETPLEIARAIEIIATVELFINGAPENENDCALVPSMGIQDEEKKMAMRRGPVTDRLKIYFGRANDICGSNGFAVGNKTTIIDFFLVGFFLGVAGGHFDGIDPKHCDAFTNIKKIADRVMTEEKTKEVMGKILA